MSLQSFLCAGSALLLLLASVLIADRAVIHNPIGVFILFVCGLFLSLGFVLFGSQRLDEPPATPEEPRPDSPYP